MRAFKVIYIPLNERLTMACIESFWVNVNAYSTVFLILKQNHLHL